MSQIVSATSSLNTHRAAHEWLVDYRFPLKHVAMLGGAAKSGKTQFVCCLAAAVTNSQIELAPGLRVDEPGNVLIVSTERTNDYFARIEVAGADISKVRIVNAERDYDFDRVIGQLQQVEPESNVRLVVLDHIGDLSEKEIRSVAKVGNIVNRLAAQAARLRCCILLVTHTVKTTNKAYRFQETFGGCAAWPRKVSDAWGMCLIKDGVGVIEHGIGAKKRLESCWEYHLAAGYRGSRMIREGQLNFEFLTIVGDWPVSYLKAFAMTEDGAVQHVSKKDRAKDLLRQLLADGDRTSKEIFERAAQLGISERTVWSAAKELGIITSGGPGSKWSLPKGRTLQKSICRVYRVPRPSEQIGRYLGGVAHTLPSRRQPPEAARLWE